MGGMDLGFVAGWGVRSRWGTKGRACSARPGTRREHGKRIRRRVIVAEASSSQSSQSSSSQPSSASTPSSTSPPSTSTEQKTQPSGKEGQGTLGSVALIAATLMWAASNAIQRQLILDGIDPSAITAARFGGSGLLFLSQLQWMYVGPGLRLALLSFGGNAMLATALTYTSAARAGFFCAMTVVITPIAAAAAKRMFPERKHIVASLISAFGVFLMAKENLDGSALSPLGDALSLVAALFFTAYTVLLGIEAPKYDTNRLTSSLRVCNGIISVGWGLSRSLTSPSSPLRTGASLSLDLLANVSGGSWIGLAVLTIFLAASGLLQVFGQKRLRSAESALIFSLVPLWSALIGCLLLQESMSLLAWIGGAVLVFGCIYGQLFGGE